MWGPEVRHKIDLSGDALISILLDSIRMEYMLSRQYWRNVSVEPGDPEFIEMIRSSTMCAAWQCTLQLAIAERTADEVEGARSLVSDGEAMMASDFWCRGAPARIILADAACQNSVPDHIVLGPGDVMLCPDGRGYWQLARLLLADDPKRLRRIARNARRRPHNLDEHRN